MALALIIASLLPAAQFVGISYATNDNGRGNGHGYGHDDDNNDNDDNNGNDDNNSDDDLVIEASKDTFIRKLAQDTNEGANDILRLTHIGSNRALVEFDLSEIAGETGGEVDSAILQLYIVRNENDWKEVGKLANTIKYQTISVHRVTQYWEEGNGSNDIFERQRGNGPGATWQCAVDEEIKNNKPDCRRKWNGGTFERSPTDENYIRNGMTGRWVEFDVTEDVNKFLSGEEENYGWLIKKDQENLQGAIRFASSETNNGPRLVFEGLGDPHSPPDAIDDYITTDEDAPVTFGVLYNDSDPDGDALTATIATNPSHGDVTVNSGTWTYAPDPDYNGQDSFTYALSDGSATDTATVTITINPVNDPPVASDPVVSVAGGGTTTITLPVTDIDSGSLIYIITDYPQHGTLGDDDGDDTITYTPDPGFIGEDSFTFKANDGSADSNAATASITVMELPDENENPVANDDSATTDEGEPVTIDVLDNDSDADGDDLDAVSASDPPQGTAVINIDNTITYTPDGTYSGTDSFTYTIEDGQGGSDSATVTVTINLVNGPPVANDDSATTDEDTPATIDVLSNDSDPDEDPFSINSVSTPTYGTAAIVSGGIFYTPNVQYLRAGQSVIDTFTYTITDGLEDDSATVTVTINGLNDAPVASDGSIITDEEELAEYTLSASDPDTGDTLTFDIETEPTSGTVSLGPAGSIEYSPDVDFSGSDSFVYSVTDGSGSSDTGTITVTVNPINDPPVAVDDAAPATSPGVPVTVDVLVNDYDPEDDPLDVVSISTPAHGTAELNSDYTITFTPYSGFVGQDAFTYTISDGNGGTATAQVTVTVTLGGIIAVDDFGTTPKNQEVEIEILTNDIGFVEDPDIPNGDRIALTGEPSSGTVTINEDGTVTYEPANGFEGVVTFVYTIYTSDFSDFDSATVTVTVENPP